tara:strand:- start:331 stop:702 length:372 start_codon:yes stop_codon:yes gene_type:complete
MDPNTKEISLLFERWNSALKTCNPDIVASLYYEKAILLPTVSNKVRHNHDEIKDYFSHFLTKEPQGEINETNIRIFEKLAINSGIYTFSLNDGSSVQARFTFVYKIIEDEWKIIEHHSSMMPE